MAEQSIPRRRFIQHSATALSASALLSNSSQAQDERPNILWITSEDNGPHMGCYGDEYADTPNLDSLASRGLIYQNAWSTAPVCAPARTCIISGMYPPSIGGEHMRSMTRLPDGFKMYPQYLREAGYYCANNSKEDYNLEKPGQVWDQSNGKAHWRNRKPGQPFFAIFNFTTTHESQIRKRPHTQVHDPEKVKIPAYHPDTPEVRQDWAQYHDKMTEMDAQAGSLLQQLEDDGLAGNTIIFYYGDHGPGMPRGKRWPYNSGLRVPMIVHIPEKWKHLAPPEYQTGGSTDRLVGFVDLAPTVLSLAGIEPPKHMQGHAFLGEHNAEMQPYLHGFRGRMDERYDLVRTVRDKQYIYLRHYMPHKKYGQYIQYMFQTPTTQVWKKLYDEGKLEPQQKLFWEPKPPEELYDLEADPDEVNNLAKSPDHQAILRRLRKAQQDHVLAIRDVGLLPEDEIHSRSVGSSPYEMGRDQSKYPLVKILAAAEQASSLKPDALPNLKASFSDSDSAVRYWAAMGALMRGKDGVEECKNHLHSALKDSSPNVRVVAAQALGQYGSEEDWNKAMETLMPLLPVELHGVYVSMLAWNAVQDLNDGRNHFDGVPSRVRGYVPRLLEKYAEDYGSSAG